MQMRAPGGSSVSGCVLCNFVHDNAPVQDLFGKKWVTEIDPLPSNCQIWLPLTFSIFHFPELKMKMKHRNYVTGYLKEIILDELQG
jgi:hypothetical protein